MAKKLTLEETLEKWREGLPNLIEEEKNRSIKGQELALVAMGFTSARAEKVAEQSDYYAGKVVSLILDWVKGRKRGASKQEAIRCLAMLLYGYRNISGGLAWEDKQAALESFGVTQLQDPYGDGGFIINGAYFALRPLLLLS